MKFRSIFGLTLISVSLCLCGEIQAQGNNQLPSQMPPLPAPASVTPPPFSAPTNSFQPLVLLGTVLPSWDPTATNTFGANELIIGTSPLWKTQTASGSTPYLSTFADYFFTRNIGVEGELVTLGDGQGNSSVDSAAILSKLRVDSGNLAGYLLAGPSFDLHNGRAGGDGGLGIAYRYHTSVEVFADTRYSVESRQADRNGWKTRAGITFAFSKYH